jgi:two-component system sensor histidine kinase MprB
VSLRVRLALVAGAAVAAAVVAASAAVFFIVRGELYGPIDTGLRQAVLNIRVPRLPVPTGSTPARDYILSGPGFGPEGAFPVPYRFIAFNGTRIFLPTETSAALRPLGVTAGEKEVAAGTAKPYFFDTDVGGQHARIYTVQFQPGYAIQIAASTNAADHALARIKLWLLLIALGGIAVASAAGFLVARASLRPVRRLSETAEHVRATRDLSRRIVVTGNDELSRLATTFNAMLASLDEAAQRQRQLVQDASHELRTPLTSLRTNIEVLASDPPMTSEEREHLLSDVVEQLVEMTALIGELTELARGEEQHAAREDVRLDLIATEAIRRTNRNHPEVAILSELEPTLLVGDPATLDRAITNLLDNAAKWSPPDTNVSVTLRDGELAVRDHGPGIPDEDLPHVFERFYRATSARSMPGSGLGLAIVKQVADAHGGTVTAERAPDGGTVMRFRLPNVTRPQDEPQVESSLARSTS